MATKGKEGMIPGKEKRGTSPSYPRRSTTTTTTTTSTTSTTVQRKRNPNISPGGGSGSPDHHKHVPTTSSSSADPKHVPNYLKPTLSSGPDPSSKKPNTPQKPTLNRRRSFDKPPPSPSGLPKTLNSPSKGERTTLRSLSASPRNTSLAKPHSERLLKAPNKEDIGKSHSLHTKHVSTVRKTTNTNIKNKNLNTASNSNSAMKKLSSCGSSSEPDDTTPTVESQLEEDQESSITEDVEEEGTVLKVELLNEISTVEKEDKEEQHVEEVEEEVLVQSEPKKNYEDEVQVKAASCEIPKVSEEEHENPFDKDHAEEEEEEEEDDKSAIIEEEIHQEVAIEDKEEGKEDGNENSKETVKDDQGNINEMPKEEEREAETANHGQMKKKESPAAAAHNHNDVIEETASKLLEKRKNKVKALVGAFETVISLQDPEPSNPNQNASKEDLPK